MTSKDSKPDIRLGIDLGGTKVEIIALNNAGEVLTRRREGTPQNDYRATLDVIAGLVLSVEDELGARGTVGLATPGSLSPATGLLKNSNSVCLNGQPIDKDLEALLERPLRFRNDADCFALSEATDGAARGAATVFGVIIGTGTGAGIVVNGGLIDGPNRIAGEWGHNPLPWPRADELDVTSCYCGLSGCLETWLSGPGMAADHRRHTGQDLRAEAIAVAAEAGDAEAVATLDRYVDRLARGLAHIINIIDPQVIVLGGGMSNIQRLYQDVPQLWQQYVFSDQTTNRLCAPKYGDSSGVRGAAWLWNN